MVINTAKWSTPVAIGASVAVGVGSFAAMYYFSSSQRRDCDEVAMLELIKRRRSVFPKQYSDKLVDRKVLEEMLEAARWAPTHNITEPWKFVVFSSSESRTQLVCCCSCFFKAENRILCAHLTAPSFLF
jgi:hypothetical protein